MDPVSILRDLTIVLTGGAAALLLFKRLRQPPVLGYLAVGLAVGPLAPVGLRVADFKGVAALGEIGVVFLLFALGVEFNLRRLARVGVRALAAAGVEAALLLGLGYCAGLLLGFAPLGALLLGGVCALASTAIVARLLLEHGGRDSPSSELVSGVLVAEDLLAVLMIAFFSSAGRLDALRLGPLVEQLVRLGMLVTLVLVSGLLILPGLLSLVERSGMREVRTLAIVGTCFGLAFLTERLGFSAALGAFLAGAMMYESASAARLRETVEPFREVFGAVFFVTVGALVDPSWLIAHWRVAAVLAAGVVAGRLAANLAALAAVGEERAGVLRGALARLPVGEFSFLLAQIGDRHGLTPWPLQPLTILLSLATTAAGAWLLQGFEAAPERALALVPARAARLLDEYRGALRRLAMPARARLVLDLVRPSLVQIVLNVLGVGGLVLAAHGLRGRYPVEPFPGALWMGTAFVSLPFTLAVWRKAQAVTLILLEAITTRGGDPRPPAEARPLLTRFLLALTTVLVAWWFLSLSLALLPPWPYALFPLAAMGAAGALLWRGMNRLYAKIQVSLRRTLAEGRVQPEASAAVVSHLVEAPSDARVRVAVLRLGADSVAAGMFLRDVSLRSETGASVVQINRGTERNTAPGGQTRLQAGDELLLVGEPAQIEAARALLDEGAKL